MKTLKIITLAIMMQFASYSTQAQVSINVDLGAQPTWGPVGYSSVNYYYLPDIQTYYDVRSTQFIYLNRGVWVRSSNLPRQYRNYDLNSGYKVVLNNYQGSKPYYNYKNDKVKYFKGYKGSPQKSIGNRKENYKGNGNNKKNNAKQGKGNNGKGNN